MGFFGNSPKPPIFLIIRAIEVEAFPRLPNQTLVELTKGYLIQINFLRSLRPGPLASQLPLKTIQRASRSLVAVGFFSVNTYSQ